MAVYFIRAENGRVKVGYTDGCPIARFRTIEAACPVDITLMGHMDGAADLERCIHADLEPYRFRREWFENVPEVHKYVTDVLIGAVDVMEPYDRVVRWLLTTNVTVARIAEVSGVTAWTLSQIRGGKSCGASAPTLRRLRQAYVALEGKAA